MLREWLEAAGIPAEVADRMYDEVLMMQPRVSVDLYKLAGYYGIEGTPVDDAEIDHRFRLDIMWVTDRLIAHNPPYKTAYDEWYTHFAERGFNIPHAHKMSCRKIAKLFLSHVFVMYMSDMGVSLRPPRRSFRDPHFRTIDKYVKFKYPSNIFTTGATR
jgi:hypothetical protein